MNQRYPIEYVRTAWRLGVPNLLRFMAYRSLMNAGYYRWRLPRQSAISGPFWKFSKSPHPRVPGPALRYWTEAADRVLAGELPVFSSLRVAAGFPPEWHRSVLALDGPPASAAHWSEGSEFALPGGDIKGYWEASRFDGLLILALGWLSAGERRFADALEAWMKDWSMHNPANSGVNWKCAQETGLRLLQTLLAMDLLERHGGVEAGEGLRVFVEQHCRRIEPTMLYAIAQDNNHATSEAAALYVAGGWLSRQGASAVGDRWQRLGRKWLESRVRRLVMPDGSFSQHSLNYHRLLLDTLWMAEVWRRRLGDAPFSDGWNERARAATAWLRAMTDDVSGDAPNLGGNDGARVFVMHGLLYRDFRPTVQTASAIFGEGRVYPPGPWDEPLAWLGIDALPATGGELKTGGSRVFEDGGYAKLVNGAAWALLRLPGYRFRPAHADALHLDLWHGGRNLLRDGGSFSYNADPEWRAYFSGTASHNTIQFDGRDPMRRLGRFLFGDWLACERFQFDAGQNTASAGYRDYEGARHHRSVRLESGRCVVEDRVDGFSRNAVLRWRLQPGTWRNEGKQLINGPFRLTVSADTPIARHELVDGYESRHYAEKTVLPVLEVEVRAAATLVTELSWLQ